MDRGHENRSTSGASLRLAFVRLPLGSRYSSENISGLTSRMNCHRAFNRKGDDEYKFNAKVGIQ